MDKPLLLRVNEAAQELGISRSKTYELLAAGILPCIKVGTSIRVPWRDLEAWIERNKEAAGAGGQEAASYVGGTREHLPKV